jgi:hypothetical protein
MTHHRPNGTQEQRILATLQAVAAGKHDIPEEYIRRHPQGDGVSARYFKQQLLISECNGRISELRSKGHVIETSQGMMPMASPITAWRSRHCLTN